MATGICSVAADLTGLTGIAFILLPINLLAFAVLWLCTGARLLLYPRRMLADLFDPSQGPGYFTLIAAAGVVGVQLLRLLGAEHPTAVAAALGLWLLALLLWLVISYAFFTAMIVRPSKPDLADGLGKGLSGAWLIASVATQAIAVLGTQIAPLLPAWESGLLFVCLVFHFMGSMLYVWIIVPIFLRLNFLPLSAAAFTPPYWINMGATAIATQAGASLSLYAGPSPLLPELLPFLKGFTLFFWAAGTWWIPLLLCLLVWTHLIQRQSFGYTPLIWGAAFPLGMYTACTYQLALALKLPWLLVIPHVSVYLALGVWLLAFIGLLRQVARGLRAPALVQSAL